MQLKELLLRFNISHFIFYCILLILSILIGLRVDDIITGSYSVLFIPLWLWNLSILVGVVMGVIRWIGSKEQRQDEPFVYQFKSMIISVLLQLFLFATELVAVVNIDTGGNIPWSAVFSPLYLLMFAGIPTCVWNCYRKRGVEIELFAFATFVQFVFLGVRLDNAVDWNWAIVLIPFWLFYLVLIVTLIVMGIATILSYAIGENQQENEERKLPDIIFFSSATLLCVFLIVFMCLLVVRLNGDILWYYSIVFIPLHLSLLALIGTTFSRGPANVWWFGARKNFVDLVLDCCPLLQEYVNVSYRRRRDVGSEVGGVGSRKRAKRLKQLVDIEEKSDMYPYEDIYMPD